MVSDAFLKILKDSTLERGFIVIKGKKVLYIVISNEVEPRLRYLEGYPDGELLFISGNVPIHYRRALLSHEYNCLRNTGPEGCIDATKDEMKLVPRGHEKDYRHFKIRYFQDLIRYYKQYGSFGVPYVKKFAKTQAWLRKQN